MMKKGAKNVEQLWKRFEHFAGSIEGAVNRTLWDKVKKLEKRVAKLETNKPKRKRGKRRGKA